MSVESLRFTVDKRLEKMNSDHMTAAGNVMPNQQSTADGIALFVVNQLALARGIAMAQQVLAEEYKKLMAPEESAGAKTKDKVEEIY